MRPQDRCNREDLQLVSSLQSALLEKTTRKSRYINWLIVLSVFTFLFWASNSAIDEISRGTGKIIPSQHVQVIQNLEGGIVAEIMVNEGQIVNKGEDLLKIKDIKSESSAGERQLKIDELRIMAALLTAEANGKKLVIDKQLAARVPEIVKNAYSSYESQARTLGMLEQRTRSQISQKTDEIKQLQAQIMSLKKSMNLVAQEIRLLEPLEKKGIASTVELLKVKRESQAINERYTGATLKIPILKAAIREIKEKELGTKLGLREKAQKQLTEVVGMITRLEKLQYGNLDQVARTLVKSPVKGKVKQLFVNTIGGVVKPGMDLIEIVPLEDTLHVEIKIKPSDIAFLYPGQKATVKVTAYDFSIHGGLVGEVINIGADTIEDEQKQSYYAVTIVTEKNHLGPAEAPLAIIPGMTVSADILTGKKTVMDYLLKPILKARNKALTER
ncbi:MAG: HlyD family type I secretion periplasmic adaptor subunit [Desulfobulbaceae bacterium]|nr:HlyD family type I secretion periplasmic adaptor subunit [Desulfobulbaceae bacterium]